MNIHLKKTAAVLAVALAALAPAAAGAAQFRADKNGAVSISSETADDLYAAGNSVSLSAPVHGDAFAAGSTVMASGSVDQGLFAAGGTVTVTGSAGDDARLAGGNLFVSGSVAHDLFALGGQVSVAPTATVGGDAFILAGSPTIEGAVNGNLYVRGGDIVIDGPIRGSVYVAGDSVSFGPKASIGGKLIYSVPSEISLPSGLAAGGVEYRKSEHRARNAGGDAAAFKALFTLGMIGKIISLFALGLLTAWIFRKKVNGLVASAYGAFGWNLLYGFAALILVPIAALIALVTLIGAPLAVIIGCAYLLLLSLAGILTPILVGAYAWRLFGKRKEYAVNAWSILAGTFAFVILSAIPLIGWLFGLAMTLVALGTLAKAAAGGLKSSQG